MKITLLIVSLNIWGVNLIVEKGYSMKILMYPDYANALFWDEEDCCIGGYDEVCIGEITIDLSCISGLKDWFREWEGNTLYPAKSRTDSQWREWWEKGVDFAKAINQLLPDNVWLSYFSLKDTVWKVKPEDTNDGGLFNYGD